MGLQKRLGSKAGGSLASLSLFSSYVACLFACASIIEWVRGSCSAYCYYHIAQVAAEAILADAMPVCWVETGVLAWDVQLITLGATDPAIVHFDMDSMYKQV